MTHQSGCAKLLKCFLLMMIIITSGCDKVEISDIEHVSKAKEFSDTGDIRAAAIELKNAIQKNPENAEARWLLGKLYLEMNDGVSAEKELRRTIELGIPKNALIIELGKAMLMTGKYSKIIDEININNNPGEVEKSKIYAIRSEAYIGKRQFKDAEDEINKTILLSKTSIEAKVMFARIAILRKDLKTARKYALKAIEMHGKNPILWILLGDIDQLENNNKAAIDAYTKALELNSKSLTALIRRAQGWLREENINKAYKDISRAYKLNDKNIIVSFLKGVVVFKKGQYKEALTIFQEVIIKVPNFELGKFWLALSHYTQGNNERSRDIARSIVIANPENIAARKLIAFVSIKEKDDKGVIEILDPVKHKEDKDILEALGVAYAGMGEYSKSADYFQQALTIPGATVATRVKYAHVLSAGDAPEKAMEEMRKAVETDPAEIDAEIALISQMVQKNQLIVAEKMLNRITVERSDDARIYNLWGGFYQQKGEVEQAKEAFSKALELKEDYAAAAHNLALMAVQVNKMDLARSYYQKILNNIPDHSPTLIAMYYLERRMGTGIERRQWLQKVLNKEQESHSSLVALLMGRDYLTTQDYQQALNVTEDAVRLYPDEASLLELRGLAQLQAKQPASALASFIKLAGQHPDVADSHYYKAQAYTSLGNYKQAILSLKKAVALDSKHLAAYAALGRLYITESQFEEAKNQVSLLKQKFNKIPEGWFVEYDMLMAQKQFERAINPMEGLIEKGTINTTIILNIAKALWLSGSKQAALARAVSWSKSKPKDIGVLLYIAAGYEALKQADNAVKTYQRVLELNADHLIALNNLSLLLMDNDTQVALKLAQRAYQLKSDAPVILDTLGMVYYKTGDVIEALKKIEIAAEAAPTNLTIQYHRALILSETGKERQAKSILVRVFKAEKDFAEKPEAAALLERLL